MNPRWKTLLLVPVALLVALPSFGAVRYKAFTETTSDAGGKPVKMIVSAHIDGERGRIEFQESTGNPILSEGTYLVTEDGARTIYLVNPEEKTYSAWDLDAMLRFAGSMMEGMGGLMKMEFSEPQVEKLLDEDGGIRQGLPVRHLRYRTTYTLNIKVLGMKRSTATETLQDLWVTDSLGDAALGAWLRDDPPTTGNEELDRLIRAEFEKAQGYPLKSETVTKNRDEKGKVTTSRTVMEVTELDRNAPAPSAESCKVPAGYTEAPLLPTGEGEDNPLKGLFGGKGGRG